MQRETFKKADGIRQGLRVIFSQFVHVGMMPDLSAIIHLKKERKNHGKFVSFI